METLIVGDQKKMGGTLLLSMRVGPKYLFIVAILAVLALIGLSDPAPPRLAGFNSIPGSQEPVQVVCQVVEVQERSNGWTVTLVDPCGEQAKAFCPSSLGLGTPAVGRVLRFSLTMSNRPGFFFVKDLAVP